jgi:hypothetical protein
VSNELVLVTGSHAYCGCLGVVIEDLKSGRNEEACARVTLGKATIVVRWKDLTVVTTEQMASGEVEFLPVEQAQADFKDGSVCTCRRRMPRWRIGESCEDVRDLRRKLRG